MRVNLNLATHPYEDAREFYTRWGSAVAAAAVISIALALLAWSSYSDAERDRIHISELRRQIAEIERAKGQNEAILNQPVNQEARDQIRFWNDVIDQKYLSWTRLFSDLEKIMPPRAFVVSVKPSLEAQQQMKLELVIGGEQHESPVDLIRRMESSDLFHLTKLKSESTANPTRGQNIFEFGLDTYYTPKVPPPPAAPAKTGTKGAAL